MFAQPSAEPSHQSVAHAQKALIELWATIKPGRSSPAILFDLDGTLIDSNYHHVEAWSEALRSAGIVIPLWKIHRRIGMSGKSFLKELLRELAQKKRSLNRDKLEQKHDILFRRLIPRLAPLPGANELLKTWPASRSGSPLPPPAGRHRPPTC